MKLKTILALLICSQLSLAQDSLDSSFANKTDLTDAQAKEAKEFVHQGKKEQAYKQGCAQNGLGDCSGSNIDSKFPIETLIGKAYAMIFGGLGFLSGRGGPTMNSKVKTNKPDSTNAPSSKPGSESTTKQDKTQTDYCMYGAIAYELLATQIQSSLQKKAQADTASLSGDPQLQALANLKETHKARQKTATMQSTVYGAITACYAYYGTFGGAATDWKYWVKLGGAGLLTTLYASKAQKHAKASKAVQKVIDGLPKAGDCNPWTGSACFCKEESSKTLYANQDRKSVV